MKNAQSKLSFTLTIYRKVGSIFEDGHLPMTKWLQAIYLMTASKKGISAHQIHHTLEITYENAWFLEHRIRAAMASADLSPFGADGGIVEVVETFIGKIKGAFVKRAFHHKKKVLALLDRNSGQARTMVINDVTAKTLIPIVRANVAKEAIIMTDEHGAYTKLADHFVGHGTTTHSVGEYVNLDDRNIHSNNVESYSAFSSAA